MILGCMTELPCPYQNYEKYTTAINRSIVQIKGL